MFQILHPSLLHQLLLLLHHQKLFRDLFLLLTEFHEAVLVLLALALVVLELVLLLQLPLLLPDDHFLLLHLLVRVRDLPLASGLLCNAASFPRPF